MKRVLSLVFRIRWQEALSLITIGMALLLVDVASLSAQQPLTPPAFTILHSFSGPPSDGRNPVTGLTLDSSGNLYGTTLIGGTANGGTVFVVRPDGSEAVLYNFPLGTNGGPNPSGVTLGTDGKFYGTTAAGGTAGAGTVFRMSPDGTVTTLYSFAGPPNDGSGPTSGVIRDGAGNLFGTTAYGGAPCASLGSTGCGTVFELSPNGTETILHSFAGGANDGANPSGGLLQDAAGNLYGVAANGGSTGNGVVFKLSPDGTETLLYSFLGPANNGGTSSGPPGNGANPSGALIQDGGGNLYGTTLNGGAYSGGTVFKLSQTGTETILLRLGGPSNDGRSPRAGLVMDAAGNLYGTTSGTASSSLGPAVFELSPDGTETVVHNFTSSEGGTTDAGLIQDAARNLYGTTFGSAAATCSVEGPGGCGVVFKLRPPTADLFIHSLAPAVAASGSSITYVIEVTNNGPDAASNVSIQDAIPAGTTFNSVSIIGGSCTEPTEGGTGMVTCTAPTLASGTTITETLVVNVTAGLGSAIMDTATVSSVTYDPSSGDNSARITTTVI